LNSAADSFSVLEQVKGYETKLQQQKTQLENSLENLEEAKQECMRLSTENGKVRSLLQPDSLL
jgi:regulator of replication initiation timing